MEKVKKDSFKVAEELGFRSEKKQLFELIEWLREEKQIHVEVSSVWDELVNVVESYCYTVTAPVFIYHIDPIYASGGRSYNEMLQQGLVEALHILREYDKQKHLRVPDDQVVIAYLKGYGDKNKYGLQFRYKTNIEKYAYLQGKQGNYIEEGLTEDDILFLVRNTKPEKEFVRPEKELP